MMTKLISAGLVLVLSLAMLSPLARAGTLTNNFDVPHNYLANGVIGDTNWDGVYMGFGDLPQGNTGGSGGGATLAADAGISFPSFLTVQTTGSDWSDVGDDGF